MTCIQVATRAKNHQDWPTTAINNRRKFRVIHWCTASVQVQIEHTIKYLYPGGAY